MTVNESGDVVQRQDYYPFGSTFNEWTSGTEDHYKYNGFEEQKATGWYDYQARFYDPALGRFLNVDPAADLMRRHSVYSYAFNNPIRFIDPDGMMPEAAHQSHDNMAASAATDDHDPDRAENDGDKDDDELFRRTYRKNGKFHIDIYHKGELSTDSRHNSVAGAGGFGEGHLGSIFGTGLNFNKQNRRIYEAKELDLALAGVGFTSFIAQGQLNKILRSRAGFSSGKFGSNSPKVYPKGRAGKIYGSMKILGAALTLYGYYDTETDYINGEIPKIRRNYAHALNTIGAFIPQIAIGIGAGDYIGTAYADEITNDITKPSGYTHRFMKFVFESIGIPTSPEK